MSTLVFAINVTADGGCDHTKFNPDDEVLDFFTQLTHDADVLLYGRKTYELMVPYWPDVATNHSGPPDGDSKFAEAFAKVPQIVVVSKTLEAPKANNTTIIRTNLKEEIQKLKRQDGKSILTGGVDLPSQLFELDLVDELYIVVHPIVSGKGRRLFDSMNLEKTLQLRLAQSRTFKSGCIALHYVKK